MTSAPGRTSPDAPRGRAMKRRTQMAGAWASTGRTTGSTTSALGARAAAQVHPRSAAVGACAVGAEGLVASGARLRDEGPLVLPSGGQVTKPGPHRPLSARPDGDCAPD